MTDDAWSTMYAASTTAPVDAVWQAVRMLHTGTVLGPGSEHYEPHGPFAVGTRMTVTPPGGAPVAAVIVEIDPPHAYADRMNAGDLTLTFRHVLTAEPGGGTHITHTLEVAGPGARTTGAALGGRIAGDFPAAMADLVAAAERLSVDGSEGAARI